jgi:uncharacterized DUF497 family protein
VDFEWDALKDETNRSRHGVSFVEAQYAFLDPHRVISEDVRHTRTNEKRFFCFGKTAQRILTVRFTYRGDKIRIFGAGYWREGKREYEKQNKI